MQYAATTPNQPNIKITNLTLTESRAYRDPWIRPYELSATHGDLNKIQETVERAINTKTVSGIENMLSSVSPNILMPSATVMGKAGIVNGWGEKRFKFVLVMEITYPGSNTTTINYVRGYSNYLGISMQGSLDPAMMLIVNSVTILRKTFDPHTGYVSTVPMYTYNIAHDEITNVDAHNSMKLARPDDVVSKIASLKSVDSNDGGVMFISDVGSVKDINVVDKSILLPTAHVGTTIQSTVETRMTASSFDDDIMGMLAGDLMSNRIEQIEFFKIMLGISGTSKNSFKLSDIDFIDPSVNANVIVGNNIEPIGSVDIPAHLKTTDTAEMYDASYETRMATVVHEAISLLLDDSLLNSVGFSITNVNGKPTWTPSAPPTSIIDGLNVVQQFEIFMQKFMQKVWPVLSNNNLSLVMIDVFAMLESDTTISVNLDNRGFIVYRLPTFADSKFLPIIMDNQRLETLADGYGEIVDTAIETAGNVLNRNSKIYY